MTKPDTNVGDNSAPAANEYAQKFIRSWHESASLLFLEHAQSVKDLDEQYTAFRNLPTQDKHEILRKMELIARLGAEIKFTLSPNLNLDIADATEDAAPQPN